MKLEHKLLVVQQQLQRHDLKEYERERLEHSFLRAWKRYVKAHSVPYNPALYSETRGTWRLEL